MISGYNESRHKYNESRHNIYINKIMIFNLSQINYRTIFTLTPLKLKVVAVEPLEIVYDILKQLYRTS